MLIGVEICCKLGWSRHIDERPKLVRNAYCGLRKLFKQIPKNEIKIRRKLFCAFALPHFVWLFFTWFFFTEKQRADIEHTYNSGIRLVYSLWWYEDLTTLALSQEYSLRDYLYRYWTKLYTHLEISPEAVAYQQTWSTFTIATDFGKTYYKSIGLRKTSKFANRLAERAHHGKPEIINFINMHSVQFGFLKTSAEVLKIVVRKYCPTLEKE